MKKYGVSALMMVLDEAKFIRHALNSIVAAVDEIVVLDTGSTDGTQDIVADVAREHHHIWLSEDKQEGPRYSKGWNQGVRRKKMESVAQNDWLFVIDGDEYYDGHEDLLRLAGEPLAFPSINVAPQGLLIARFMGHSWYPDVHTRLYNRTTDSWSLKNRHGGVESAGQQTDAAIWHYHACVKNLRRTQVLNGLKWDLLPLSRKPPVVLW